MLLGFWTFLLVVALVILREHIARRQQLRDAAKWNVRYQALESREQQRDQADREWFSGK